MESFRVRLFASFADVFGVSHLDVSLPVGATVSDLAAAIHNLPRAKSLPPRLVLAVNASYADPERVLASGDEIALIPPVAGG